MSTPLTDIEARTKALAEARTVLAGIVTELNDGIEALKRQHMRSLKAAVSKVAQRHAELKALIEEHPDLFVKPRTVVFHGVKVGLQKGKGVLEFDDPERVVALIEKWYPDQVDVLVATRKTPVKDALQQLTGAELKKLGIRVTEADDQVVIKPTDSDVDKLVNALVKGATEEAES